MEEKKATEVKCATCKDSKQIKTKQQNNSTKMGYLVNERILQSKRHNY